MSMTETPIDPPKPKRKYKRRTQRVRAAAAAKTNAKPTGMFEGLTVSDCPTACNSTGCVISGRNYCAHPRKGGLQGRDMQDQNALDRVNQAQKKLGTKAMELKYA